MGGLGKVIMIFFQNPDMIKYLQIVKGLQSACTDIFRLDIYINFKIAISIEIGL